MIIFYSLKFKNSQIFLANYFFISDPKKGERIKEIKEIVNISKILVNQI